MVQQEPAARIEAVYRNEWPGSAVCRAGYRGVDTSGRPCICWLRGISCAITSLAIAGNGAGASISERPQLLSGIT
jgi:hypothetical protein